MTKWSREYLYTGNETDTEKQAEVCETCRNGRPQETEYKDSKNNTCLVVGMNWCREREAVTNINDWCPGYIRR